MPLFAIVKVTVPWLIELLCRVDGMLTARLAVSVTLVWPAWPITSNVCVLVAAGPTRTVVEPLDDMCVASAANVATIEKLKPVELVMFVGVKMTWQLAEEELAGPKVQPVELNAPVPPAALGVADQVMLPVGTTNGAPLVSVTVTPQTVVAPMTSGLWYVQLTAVMLARTIA